MSYILDALKKAERERDMKRVPTLMAEHELKSRNRKNYWIMAGALVIIAGVVFWFASLMQQTMNPKSPAQTYEQYPQTLKEPEEPPAETIESSTATASKPKAKPEKATEPSAYRPGAIPSINTIDIERLRQMSEWTAEASRRDERDPENDASLEMAREQPPSARASGSLPKAAAGPGDKQKQQPASLKEALNGLTLSVLLYDDNKADRMVFINGRKYVEGDYVEDKYYLESITLDGAVLTYQNERVLLKPRAK